MQIRVLGTYFSKDLPPPTNRSMFLAILEPSNPDSPSHSWASDLWAKTEPLHLHTPDKSALVQIHRGSWPCQAWDEALLARQGWGRAHGSLRPAPRLLPQETRTPRLAPIFMGGFELGTGEAACLL